eukprot:12117832-Prorocentrum_lima.AAC.1
MTSSLVGSEMCIRDSLKRATDIWASDEQLLQDIRPLQCNGRHNHVPISVSYTHLTLPTICSV